MLRNVGKGLFLMVVFCFVMVLCGFSTQDGRLIVSGNATLSPQPGARVEVELYANKFYDPNAPDFDTTINGVRLFTFDKAKREEVHTAVKLPCQMQLTTDRLIYPHIHWMPTTSDGGSVRWCFEYSTAGSGSTFGAPVLDCVDAPVTEAWQNTCLHFSAIDPGETPERGTVVIGRIYRDAANTADDYNADAALIRFNVKYSVSSFGITE